MAICKHQTGNNAAAIAQVLEQCGLFHAVSLNETGNTVSCRGADGELRFTLKTSSYEGTPAAECSFYVSAESRFINSGSLAVGRALAVQNIYTCSRGVILDCVKGAVLLTKNNRGELLYAVTDWSAADKAAALRSMRVYSYGDTVRSSYPLNLSAAYNQRDSATAFVPFVSDPADSTHLTFAPHAYHTPYYQYSDSGTLTFDTRRFLTFAGCWAIED